MTSMNDNYLSPDDEGFDTARQAWNLAVDQRPAAVAFPNNAGDMAAALRVAVQGPGHGAAVLGDLAGTLLVKTARMTGLEVDPGARRARVEAGVLWADVAVAAGEHGPAAPPRPSPAA